MESTQDYVQWKDSVLDAFNFLALITIFKYNKFMTWLYQLQARRFSIKILLFHYFCMLKTNMLTKDSELQQWK